MTYLDLLNKLNELPAERLNDNVAVYVVDEDEFSPAHSAVVADEYDQVLDKGHFYLKIR